MQAITILIEFDDAQELPSFTAGMQLLGGVITRVQFSDLFAECDEADEAGR